MHIQFVLCAEDGYGCTGHSPSHFTLRILQVKQPVLTFGAFARDLFFGPTCPAACAFPIPDGAAAISLKMILERQFQRDLRMMLKTDADA
jgi:hypothetical protein